MHELKESASRTYGLDTLILLTSSYLYMIGLSAPFIDDAKAEPLKQLLFYCKLTSVG